MKQDVQTLFTISDLEMLSGIKAHTIRIWEKRYGLLQPARLNSNVRRYDGENLKRLLNISALYHQGVKISKIAEISQLELEAKVRELFVLSEDPESYLAQLKIAVIDFDRVLFESVYSRLRGQMSFTEAFDKVLVPMLHFIGAFWQTNSIEPIHEHFISNLIRQKVIMETAKLIDASTQPDNEVCFVLFLPDGEIHDIGLLFVQYLLSRYQKRIIYIGSHIGNEELNKITKLISGPIHFVTHLTRNADYLDFNALTEDLNLRNDENLSLSVIYDKELTKASDEVNHYKFPEEFVSSL